MPRLVALLHAVNVGGTGKLAMADLRRLCEDAGLRDVQTFIASGNVVFDTDDTEDATKVLLERCLSAFMHRPARVALRSAAALAAVLENNPFPLARPDQTAAIFLDLPPDPAILNTVTGRTREEVALGHREIYVHYPDGMGRSRLRIPGAGPGTARNMNTVAALAGLALGSP